MFVIIFGIVIIIKALDKLILLSYITIHLYKVYHIQLPFNNKYDMQIKIK